MTSPGFSTSRPPWVLLQMAAKEAASLIREALLPYGVTEQQLCVLRAVSPGGARQIEIAQKTGVTPQTTLAAVRVLVNNGILKAPVTRHGEFTLTENGDEALEAVEEAVRGLERQMGEALGEDGRDVLRRFITAVNGIRSEEM